MVRWLASPLSLRAGTSAADCLWSKSFFVLCHLELRSGLSLRLLTLLRESVRVVARRQVVVLVLDSLNLQAGCYLLVKELVFVLLLKVSERIGLAYPVGCALLHLLLRALLQRVPLLLEFVNKFFVHRL